MTSLYILSLYENRITGIIPTGLGSMRSLGILYLDDNSLSGTIPSGISSLTDLTTVTLQKNFLTMGGLSTLPPSTFSVPTQQGALNVSANCISYTSLYRREHDASPTRCKCELI
jgi:Leucine-rich repeat (LRR) protein